MHGVISLSGATRRHGDVSALYLIKQLKHDDIQNRSTFPIRVYKVRENAKIRNRYNQIPHLTQDAMCECDKKTKNMTKSQKVSPFPTGDHKATIKRHHRRQSVQVWSLTNVIYKRQTAYGLVQHDDAG